MGGGDGVLAANLIKYFHLILELRKVNVGFEGRTQWPGGAMA